MKATWTPCPTAAGANRPWNALDCSMRPQSQSGRRTEPAAHLFRRSDLAVTEDRLLVSAQSHPDRSVSPIFQYGFWKVSVIRKHAKPGSWRHLIPGACLLAGIALLLGARGSEPEWFRIVEVCIHHRLCGIRRAVLCSFCGRGISDSQAPWMALPSCFTGHIRNVSPFLRTRFRSGARLQSHDCGSPFSYTRRNHGNYAVIAIPRDPVVRPKQIPESSG